MRRITKYPVTGSTSNVVLKSDDGLFELVKESGTGVKNTPWTGLRVYSHGDAEKHVVEVRLNSTGGRYDGNPVNHKYYGAYVAHGMRGVSDSHADTRRYIEVLQSALDFAIDCESWIKKNGYAAE